MCAHDSSPYSAFYRDVVGEAQQTASALNFFLVHSSRIFVNLVVHFLSD
jgi:hypothetical protein